MHQKSLQWFLNEIQAKGVFEVSDFDLSKVYLQKLVREARKLGYQIEPVRKSGVIIKYKLTSNKKPLRKSGKIKQKVIISKKDCFGGLFLCLVE